MRVAPSGWGRLEVGSGVFLDGGQVTPERLRGEGLGGVAAERVEDDRLDAQLRELRQVVAYLGDRALARQAVVAERPGGQPERDARHERGGAQLRGARQRR